MQILFLGAGSAHTVGGDNFQSNMVLTADNGRRLLIDCGSDIRWSLAKQGLSHLDITDIYISHLHSDHVGGMEYIGFTTKFEPRCSRPRLYVESSLAGPLWDHSLRGGMGLISGSETTLETFFDVRPFVAHRPFEWEGIGLEAVPTIHVSSPRRIMYSYGLLLGDSEERTLLTTDTQYTPGHLSAAYASAGLIFHDCETGNAKTGVHAHYDELVQLPAAVRAKIWLYGYQPGLLPDAVADGFRGFVRPGQRFELSHSQSLAREGLRRTRAS